MDRNKMIIANWKMNPQTSEEALRLARKLTERILPKNIEIIIAPPFVYLDLIKKHLGNKNVRLAIQNISWAERGAYTGEISGLMAKNMGCDYAIIGHSERRYKIGETEEMINLKIKEALKVGLIPVLAVGEKNRDDDIMKTLSNQVKSAFDGLEDSDAGRVIIAYEPVWAIGTGFSDSSDHALSSALLIRKILSGIYNQELANNIPVLYGGSVSPENFRDFISQKGINGALVGNTSLEAEEFLKIVKIAGENEK